MYNECKDPSSSSWLAVMPLKLITQLENVLIILTSFCYIQVDYPNIDLKVLM